MLFLAFGMSQQLFGGITSCALWAKFCVYFFFLLCIAFCFHIFAMQARLVSQWQENLARSVCWLLDMCVSDSKGSQPTERIVCSNMLQIQMQIQIYFNSTYSTGSARQEPTSLTRGPDTGLAWQHITTQPKYRKKVKTGRENWACVHLGEPRPSRNDTHESRSIKVGQSEKLNRTQRIVHMPSRVHDLDRIGTELGQQLPQAA